MNIAPEKERFIKLVIIGAIDGLVCLFLLSRTFNFQAWQMTCAKCIDTMGMTLLPNTLLYWGYSLVLIISYLLIVNMNLRWAWFTNIILLILFVPFVFIAANI